MSVSQTHWQAPLVPWKQRWVEEVGLTPWATLMITFGGVPVMVQVLTQVPAGAPHEGETPTNAESVVGSTSAARPQVHEEVPAAAPLTQAPGEVLTQACSAHV